jgi:hypothetical protein
MIVHPADQAAVQANGFTTLRAVATDPETGMLTGAALDWQSSREGRLGEGDTLQVLFKMEGEQLITVTATDSAGSTAQNTITIQVRRQR